MARVHLALAELDRVAAARDLLPDCLLRVEVAAALVDVRELDRVADAIARVRLLLARDHPQERRLAGAVRADDADDPAGRQREGQVLEEEPVAVALADAVGLDDDVAEPRPGGMWISTRRASPSAPRRAASRRPSLRLRFAWRAFGEARTHSSSRARALRRADSCFSSPPAAPASARARTSSCPRTGCPCRGRARGSSWRRCRGSIGRG